MTPHTFTSSLSVYLRAPFSPFLFQHDENLTSQEPYSVQIAFALLKLPVFANARNSVHDLIFRAWNYPTPSDKMRLEYLTCSA